MTYLEECVRDSLPVWEKCLKTEFLKNMADGSLDEECLKGYIVDDSLYLREYAKVFAWGIIRAERMEEIRLLYSLMAFVNENEDAVRLHYLKRFGLTDDQIQTLPLRPENQAYINTMIETAKEGQGAAECLMACLPCMLSYSWIFRKLVSGQPSVIETSCGPLIEEYASDAYRDLCLCWMKRAEELCGRLSGARREKCRKVFYACSEHEYRFWQMSSEKRNDL